VSSAPVCHIPVDQAITDQPRPARFAPIPPVVDLKSAIAAINVLHMIIQQITGQIPPRGGAGAPGGIGAAGGGGSSGEQGKPGKDGKPGKTPKAGRFIETQRVTKTVKIYQDNDHTSDNWVEIERINKVVWTDQVTGELIVWSR
jgi:hypothetical protein